MASKKEILNMATLNSSLRRTLSGTCSTLSRVRFSGVRFERSVNGGTLTTLGGWFRLCLHSMGDVGYRLLIGV